MVSEIASRPPLRAVAAVAPEQDPFAERWREWQLRNGVTSRVDARRAVIGFALLFTGVGAWLAGQLLARSI